ncbi:MAG: AbrB/MazE/SpoVT family DNA-binding domain-containing protein [Ilumatobacteraceae bacterium]|nr:AbrB/MazE/SpoVT family DNA-binding domain-containing protein [Ilumatobacteraceae bacterium]
MMVAIDRAGRVVIPKEVRDRLSIDADTELEVTVDGDGIRLTPRRARGRVVVDDDGWPVIERVPGVTITDADVQRWRDADQR